MSQPQGTGTPPAQGATPPAPQGEGTPAATPPAASATPPAPAQPSASWTDSFAPEIKGYVELKGFKDPASVVESYKNLESLHGVPAERLLKLPEKADSPDWQKVYYKLGRPEKHSEYQLELPKETPDEHKDWMQKTLWESGLSKQNGETLIKKLYEKNTELAEAAAKQKELALAEEQKGLRTEWGMAFEKNMNIVEMAKSEFGLNSSDVEILANTVGYKKALTFLHKVGVKLGEGEFIPGGQTNFSGVLTPAQALAKLDMLKQDTDFIKRYANGDANAKLEMDRLHKYAYPDTNQ